MRGPNLGEALFWPGTPFPWVAGMAAFAFLSTVGFQRLPALDALGTPGNPVSAARLLPLFGLVVLLNLVLFWQHVSPHYVENATAVTPWLLTFGLLSAAYFLIYLFLVAPPLGAVPGLRTTLIMSQLGVYVTLVTSQLWTGTKPGAEAVRDHRRSALRLLEQVIGNEPLTQSDKTDLIAALSYLATTGRSTTLALRARRDRDAVHRWARAAHTIQGRLDTMEATKIRPSDIDQSALTELQR
jgi:hypothetical protein